MTVKEYISKALETIAASFPQVNIKYAYNKIIRTHIIQFSPDHEFYNNEQLDHAWIPVSFDFKITYPDQDIAFISAGSSLAIEHAEMEFNVPCPDFIEAVYSEFFIKEISYTFPVSVESGQIINDSLKRVLQKPKQLIDDNFQDYYYQTAA